MTENYQPGLLPLGPRSLEAGETVSSWIDRAASLHGTSRADLLHWASGKRALSAKERARIREMDLDADLPRRWCRRLERAARMTGKLRVIEKGKASTLLSQDKRHAYCPMCFARRIKRHAVPHFKAEWAQPVPTYCRIHLCPLFMWKHPENDYCERRLLVPWLDAACGVRSESSHPAPDANVGALDALIHIMRHADRPAGFYEHDLFDARIYAALDPVPEPRSLQYDLKEWRAHVAFERDMFAMRAGRTGILAELESDDIVDFVRDLYCLFSSLPSEHGFKRPPIEGRGGGGIYTHLRTKAGYRHWSDDWQGVTNPAWRRGALDFVHRALRRHFEHRPLWGTSSRLLGDSDLISAISDLRGEPLRWFLAKARGWPEPVRGNVSKAFASAVESAARGNLPVDRALVAYYANAIKGAL